MFFEQKSLYTRIKGAFVDSAEPLFGARVRRHGSDVTVVTYGATLHPTLEVCDEVAGEGIDAEVIDLRVLCPLDWETVAASVARTSRCLIVHEDYADYGVGAEIAARLASERFVDLDAPIARVGARFWPIPFSPPLEAETLPSRQRIADAVRDVASF